LVCHAGGTLDFSRVEALLKQKPRLSAFVFQSFVLPNSAFAEIRLGTQFSRLSAYRLGPYSFRAKPKDALVQGSVEVTLCTRITFLDRSGNVLPQNTDQEFQAVAVKEEPTAIFVREITAADTRPACP